MADKDQPPATWSMARVISTSSSPDKLTRVATLRAHKSTFTRHLVKLVALPKDNVAVSYFTAVQAASDKPMAVWFNDTFTILYKQHPHAQSTLQNRVHLFIAVSANDFVIHTYLLSIFLLVNDTTKHVLLIFITYILALSSPLDEGGRCVANFYSI